MAQTNTSRDAISVIRKDHHAIEQLFRQFERSKRPADRKRAAERIVRELSVHAAIEEQLVYPALKQRLDGQQHLVLLALEEHHVAKVSLAEIESLDGTEERFEAKVRVLIDSVRRHMKEEERELLPAMRRIFSAHELHDLGVSLEQAKGMAPTRPHPTAPDEPPGNILSTPAAAAYDRSRDALGRGIERVLDRGRGVVEEALRRSEMAARRARQRIARGLERAGREVRPDTH